MLRLTPLDRRRLANFRANKRAFWSLRIFLILFGISLLSPFVANDKPLVVSFDGGLVFPIISPVDEVFYGGDAGFVGTDYADPFIQDLIRTNGDEELAPGESPGWMVWPVVPFHYATVDFDVATAPSPPDSRHWLGTDDQARDVLARIIYGFRLSVLFGFGVTLVSALIGVLAGAAQGFFGGWVDLFFQRVEEVFSSMNLLYVVIIVASVLAPTLWVMFAIFVVFSWHQLTGLVRAEFLRARNFEYVQAARALGVSDWRIMFRHLLPNAMVATLTYLPFLLTSSIGLLAMLDFLGFGLGNNYPSLGELALQGKNYVQDPHLGFAAFFTFAIMLSLLVFIFEGIRDAFDPRKAFA
ncbi:MAG: ABC transporter permease [Pseudomonadota bacterium]